MVAPISGRPWVNKGGSKGRKGRKNSFAPVPRWFRAPESLFRHHLCPFFRQTVNFLRLNEMSINNRRKSSVLSGGGGSGRAPRQSILLSPQQRLSNFKQTVTLANVTVNEKSQVVKQNIKKKLDKRRKKLINAQNLLQQLGEMSGINDANLLYGEKPPVGDVSASMMMVEKGSASTVSFNPVDEQVVKPKKDFRYKLKSFKRRAEQKVLESFGKSPQRKMKETEFEVMWDKVSTQEQIWKELKDKCKDLVSTMETMGSIGSDISALLVELCKEEESEHSEPQIHTLPLLKLQYSMDTISKDTIPRVVDNQLQDVVCQPLKEWREEFPSYQACLQKRDGLSRDVDAYERKLMTLEDKAIDRRDPAEIARRKDQLLRAELRFKNFNSVFIKHLKEVDSQKFDKAQIIGDGVLEALRAWHETCSQLLPPSYTFDVSRNTPGRKGEPGFPTTPSSMSQRTEEEEERVEEEVEYEDSMEE